jgi:hypothetical protein
MKHKPLTPTPNCNDVALREEFQKLGQAIIDIKIPFNPYLTGTGGTISKNTTPGGTAPKPPL